MTRQMALLDVSLGSRASGRDRRLRRVSLIWVLLWINGLGSPGSGSLLPIPHSVFQLITQGSLPLAFVLALTVNRNLSVRPNWFLGLFSILALTSLMMSVRLVGLGTTYRGFRFVGVVAVLWLLTPWWRDRGLVLLRTQLGILSAILASLLLGILLSPSRAFALNYGSPRLAGVIWPFPATAVGHYTAELTGLILVLWLCGAIRRRPALILGGLGMAGLLASHTRTALVGLVFGLAFAGLSLFVSKRRVRQVFVAAAVAVLVVLAAFAPLVSAWLVRGQDTQAVSSLSGRTSYWHMVLTEPRPETNKIFGSGMTNDGVENGVPGEQGLPIDSSWISAYQNQGVTGVVLLGSTFLLLIVVALRRPPGMTRALALFLIGYSVFSSFTETGASEASPHLLDVTLAASLLVPRARLISARKGGALVCTPTSSTWSVRPIAERALPRS